MADKKYNLKFQLSNGEELDAGIITCPQGDKGDTGANGKDGVSVTGVTLTEIE